jgi:tyrosyl-tRNA synthetase
VDGDAAALTWVLREAGLASSTSEGRRLIEQGGVSMDGERVIDPSLPLHAGRTALVQVGKRRFARVTLEPGGPS